VLHSTLEIRLPVGFKPSRQQGAITSPAFYCKFFREVSSNSARIHIDYHTTADHVTPKDMPKHIEAVQTLALQANFPVTGPQKVIDRGTTHHPRR